MSLSFSTDLQAILKTSLEPYLSVSDQQVHETLTADPLGYLSFCESRIQAIADKKDKMALPPKQLLEDSCRNGDFRSMPCITEHHGITTKTVKIVGTNLEQEKIPGQITVGKAFALHPIENYITHIFDACLLSSARTGICATLGQRLLCPELRSLCLIGCGRVGYYTAIYMLAANTIEKLTLIDLNFEAVEALKRELGNFFPNLNIEITDTIPKGCDVISIATDSAHPLISPDDSDAKLIISVGADTDSQSELSIHWSTYDLFVDTLDSAYFGDLQRWIREKRIEKNSLTDLFTMMSQDSPTLKGATKVYISTGSALFDNLTIAYLLEHLYSDN